MAAYPSGLGNDQQATQATAAMRSEPWYLQWLTSKGVTPGPDQQVKLSKDQQDELYQLAQAHGIGLNNKYDQIDENGQISEGHHKLRNTLIGAGLGAAALTGFGAAGIGPLSGLFGAGAGAAGAGGGAAAAGAGAGSGEGVLGTAGGVLSAGSKIAGLLGAGKDLTSSFGAQDAATANQLANNRIAAAKVDQGGPAADQTSFRNAMRAGLVSRMNPNAAPLQVNGHTLPSLANADTTGYADTMFKNLSARQAAGQSPTEFGVPNPTQAELDAGNKAKTLGTTGSLIDTGSKIANLFGLLNRGSSTTGSVPIPGEEFDPNMVYGQ